MECSHCDDTGIMLPYNVLEMSIEQLKEVRDDEYQIACEYCDFGNSIIPNVIGFTKPPLYKIEGTVRPETAFALFEKLMDEKISQLKSK